MMNLSKLTVVGDVLKQHSPTILTWLGVTGLVSTVVLAVKATPRALAVLEDAAREKEYIEELPEPLTVKETVLLTWKYYVPSAAMGLLTVGCMIGANSISLRRNAVLASVYSITEATLREYQEKVVETIGDRKEKAIRDEVAQDKLKANPLSSNTVILTGRGEALCYDALSGRYFYSDIEKIRRIENQINHDLVSDMWVTLNEVYSKLGLEGIDLGDDMGWNADKLLDIQFSSKLTDTGEPCLVIDYQVRPKQSYRNSIF